MASRPVSKLLNRNDVTLELLEQADRWDLSENPSSQDLGTGEARLKKQSLFAGRQQPFGCGEQFVTNQMV